MDAHRQESSATTSKPVLRSVIWRRRGAIWARWLHLYLSMVSFAVILFFAVTGLTLNHADRLSGRNRVVTYRGVITAATMQAAGGPDRLALVEQLRREHLLRGAVSDFRTEEDQTSVTFKGPGYTADAFVDRPSGKYQLVETRSGAVAVLNDLHRGAVTGRAWSAVIDASAILLTLVSLTGLLLLFFVYKRRISGLILAAAGAMFVAMVWRFIVP